MTEYDPRNLPTLLIVLNDQPTIYIEELLEVSKQNEKNMGKMLISALEYVLEERKMFKEFTDELIDESKGVKRI